jgi:hypothetical protein
MQSHDYEAYAVSSLPAATNARFDSFHRQRASLTPPDSVHSSRQNARSSRQPFGFRRDLCRGVALRIPPLPPCSIAPPHSPRPKSRPKHRFSAHSGPSVHSDNFRPASSRKHRVHLQFMPCDHTIGKQRLI